MRWGSPRRPAGEPRTPTAAQGITGPASRRSQTSQDDLDFLRGQEHGTTVFRSLKREPDVRDVAAVDLRVDPDSAGGAPITLVRMAVDARRRALRESSEIDEFWCVFDVEWPTHHPSLHDALELAERNDIHVAVSNPCFELWLALHFKDVRAFHDNDQPGACVAAWTASRARASPVRSTCHSARRPPAGPPSWPASTPRTAPPSPMTTRRAECTA